VAGSSPNLGFQRLRDYAEIQFATQEDANAAVAPLNEILQTATGLSVSSSEGMRGT
jgi:hypothetical protein